MLEEQVEQLAEYQAQLAEINEMIEAEPEDESLLKLKSDMEELIKLTKTEMNNGEVEEDDGQLETEKTIDDNILTHTTSVSSNPPDEAISNSIVKSTEAKGSEHHTQSTMAVTEEEEEEEEETSHQKPKNKKAKVPSEFSAPSHLIPLPSDTDAEKNKKRRTLKALKSKWRERVKEISSEKKQKSWKDFSSKKKRKNKESIFRTEDGVSARVGVVGSGKSTMTEYGERKRFKL